MGCKFTLILYTLKMSKNSQQRQYGWRTAKRPGVDYFLAYISQFYEVVIFTSQPYYVSDPTYNSRHFFIIKHLRSDRSSNS